MESCTKCGCPDTPKRIGMVRGKLHVYGHCIICAREDQRERNHRYYAKHGTVSRAGDFKYQAFARKYYRKNRMKILESKRKKYRNVLKDRRKRFVYY